MKRLTQTLIIYAACAFGALLQSCSTAKPIGVTTISESELSKGMRDKWPNAKLIFEDRVYQIVSASEVRTALAKASATYRVDVSDCDDVTADALYFLRSSRYSDRTAIGAPAAGRLAAKWGNQRHGFIWFIDGGGRVQVIEPYTGRTVTNEINPWRIQDK
jgi:hypothetical protein